MSEPPLFGLAPHRGYLDSFKYPKSAKLIRAVCGHLCWISAVGQQWMVDHPDHETRCRDCIDLTAASGRYMIPGEVDTVREAFGDEAARNLRKYMKRCDIEEL